jgi:catechol 2,3-dioxygenase-like lactoylglutathione lyase family enzyme
MLRISLLVLLLCSSALFAAEKEMFVFNEDCDHYFCTRTADEMDVAHLEAFVDQYADGKVTHLFLNPNGQRAAFRSKTREAIWDPVPGVSEEDLHRQWQFPGTGKNYPARAKMLYDNGIDLYAVWIRRCREKGISPWLSMRMNDVHYVEAPLHFVHSEFRRSHPELWRVPNDTSGNWDNRALDYAHQAVREHQFAFVQELLERYDPDGIELDWLRFPRHLRDGHFKEDAHFIDEFVRDVRTLTKEWAAKRGHGIGLAVRAPAFPDAAEGLGINAVRWAKEGWVDLIIAAPFWATTDYDIRIDLWRERLGDAAANVRVLSCSELLTRAFPGANIIEYTGNKQGYGSGEATAGLQDYDLSLLYGFVDNARFRKTDGIYLFNWFDYGPNTPPESNYHKLLTEGVGTEIVEKSERRYPVTYRDTVPPGVSNNVQLPKETDVVQTTRIPVGSVPKNGSAFLILGFEKRDGLESAVFSASLNGKDLGRHEEEKEFERLGSSPQRAVKFRCPLESFRAGENEMVLKPTVGTKQCLIWVELRVVP